MFGNRALDGMPGRPRLADARAVQLRGRPADRPSGVADAKLVEHVVRERALVAGRERPGRRVLRAERAGRDAAAVGQRRDRDELFLESRQAPEHLIAVRRKNDDRCGG